MSLKSREENPAGLHLKYIVSKVDGTPVDPGNVYFVLKLEGEGDPRHVEASRVAVLKYADEIQPYMPDLARDIRERYDPDMVMNRYVEEMITSEKDGELMVEFGNFLMRPLESLDEREKQRYDELKTILGI